MNPSFWAFFRELVEIDNGLNPHQREFLEVNGGIHSRQYDASRGLFVHWFLDERGNAWSDESTFYSYLERVTRNEITNTLRAIDDYLSGFGNRESDAVAEAKMILNRVQHTLSILRSDVKESLRTGYPFIEEYIEHLNNRIQQMYLPQPEASDSRNNEKQLTLQQTAILFWYTLEYTQGPGNNLNNTNKALILSNLTGFNKDKIRGIFSNLLKKGGKPNGERAIDDINEVKKIFEMVYLRDVNRKIDDNK